MKINLGYLESHVEATDSQKLLDPRILKTIVRACVEAVREDQAREKRRAQDRELSNGVAPERL